MMLRNGELSKTVKTSGSKLLEGSEDSQPRRMSMLSRFKSGTRPDESERNHGTVPSGLVEENFTYNVKALD